MICRGCHIAETEKVFSMGNLPLANSLLSHPQEQYRTYPLELMLCPECSLVQLSETVDPKKIFLDYNYFTSCSPPMVEHAKKLVGEVRLRKRLDGKSLVVEIGSNDGYLLQFYEDVPTVGIDPAVEASAQAAEKGIEVIPHFFSSGLAHSLGKKADVIHANNVLAHVPDINDFISGINFLLKDDGVAVVEVPYVCRMIDKTNFDQIYHEHVFYFSLTALKHLFNYHGLIIIDVKGIPEHGGSLRLYLQKTGEQGSSVFRMLSQEVSFITDPYYYMDFAVRAHWAREMTRKYYQNNANKRQAGFGAAAKATIFLNYCGLTVSEIDCVADDTPAKQGKFIPGTGIPIVSAEEWLKRNYPETIIFAWNFAHEISHQYRNSYKGKFLTWYSFQEEKVKV